MRQTTIVTISQQLFQFVEKSQLRTHSNRALTFSRLDDLALACANGRESAAIAWLEGAQFSHLGPIVEYYIHQNSLTNLPSLMRFSESPITRELKHLCDARRYSLALQPKSVEIRVISLGEFERSEPEWIAFQQRFKKACEAAGFSTRIAAGITGAFGEMVDNALIHSQDCSPIVGYQWRDGLATYCVADSGIGVLSSLKECPEFCSLDNYGDALRSAVQDGISRFGRQRGRGLGFKQVLKSLAGLSGNLRFRSGDFSLELEGQNLTYLTAKLSQRAPLQGFVASVTCVSR